MIDKIMRTTKLLDIYGSLLTEAQLAQCRLHFDQDYSLSEIAEEYQISRQAVHDSINRASQALESFENKLGLLKLYDCLYDIDESLEKLNNLFDKNDISSEAKVAYEHIKDVVSEALK